jgi:hypothetical protein
MEIGTMTFPAARTAETKRDTTDTALRTSLIAAREATDRLFALVRRQALYERPIRERHRLIFYLGHLEAFDWNLIGVFNFGLGRLHQEFDRLFAFGIDPTQGDLPQDKPRDWPRIEEVLRYGAAAGRIDRSLEGNGPAAGLGAIEHRLIRRDSRVSDACTPTRYEHPLKRPTIPRLQRRQSHDGNHRGPRDAWSHTRRTQLCVGQFVRTRAKSSSVLKYKVKLSVHGLRQCRRL